MSSNGGKTHTRDIFFFIVACGLIFVFIEGLSSTLLFAGKVWSQWRSPVPERVHTRYDAELGWVAVPNLYIDDLYGPGIYLRTNSQGFRNNEDFHVEVPPNRIRIICSGDSFTLGWGVNHDQNWCQLLESFDARLQTVNMGQSGYGIDQAYLWYLREGTPLEHQVQLFAFITDDFNRMRRSNFVGYDKPILKLHNGNLITENIPVPRRAYYVPWLSQNLHLFGELRSIELPSKFANKFMPWYKDIAELKDEETYEIALKMFERLNELNKKKNSLLVLVYLPSGKDYESNASSNRWRKFLRSETIRHQISFIDLFDDLQQLSSSEVEKMFLRQKAFPHYHYSVEGNEYFAKKLYNRLTSIAVVSTKLPNDS